MTTEQLTVPAILAATVERFGPRPALVDGAHRRTWDELAADVRRRASALRARGVGPGEAVALVIGNNVDFVTAFLAVTSAGAVAVPLNPQFTVDELGFHLQGCDVVGIVAGDALTTRIRHWAATSTAAKDAWVEAARALDDGTEHRGPAHVVQPDWPALYAYSSGSTGTPKGMLRTHANLAHEANQFFDTVGVTDRDVILTVVALFHAHGLGNCLLASIRSGASMVLLEQFQRDAVFGAFEEQRVSVFPGVPFIFHTLAETRRADRVDTSSLRLCFSAGAPLSQETFELFRNRFGLPVRQLYGCSEAGSVTINLGEDAVGTAASVGRPMKGVDLAVTGEHGEPVAPATTGEISFASGALTAGYVEVDPEVNEVFQDGWFRTGDVGHLDEAGNLFVTGRTTLFISTSGYKVDPFEVEAVLREHPGVADVVVVGVKGSVGEEVVKAVVVPADSATEGDRLRHELQARCRAQLAVYKVPRIVELRDQIPRSPLGKIQRKYLV